jgi:hypothetical protein
MEAFERLLDQLQSAAVGSDAAESRRLVEQMAGTLSCNTAGVKNGLEEICGKLGGKLDALFGTLETHFHEVNTNIDGHAKAVHIRLDSQDAKNDDLREKVNLLVSDKEKFSQQELNRANIQDNLDEVKIDISRFSIDKSQVLGEGGFAKVYRGIYLGAPCAVKVTDLSALTMRERAQLVADFGKELSVMKRLCTCPRIVRVYGYCELVAQQKLALLMELAPGGTVSDLLEDLSVPLTDLQKAILIKEAAMGMTFLIEQGVFHRDLKSANLLLDKDGHLMVSECLMSICSQHECLMSRHSAVLCVLIDIDTPSSMQCC